MGPGDNEELEERPTVPAGAPEAPRGVVPEAGHAAPKPTSPGHRSAGGRFSGEHGELGAVVGDSAVPAVAGWGEGPPLRFYFFSAGLSLIN